MVEVGEDEVVDSAVSEPRNRVDLFESLSKSVRQNCNDKTRQINALQEESNPL